MGTPDISDESFTSRMLYTTIRSRFPNVKQLSTSTLKEWLSKENITKTLLLVDVRSYEEYSISKIPGCYHVLPGSDCNSIIHQIETLKIKKIVAYCSVGYRSCSLIQKIYSQLKTQNYDMSSIELYNLEGSIFKWANESNLIVDSNGENTIFVHPYNAVWGKFLNYDRRKYPEQS